MKKVLLFLTVLFLITVPVSGYTLIKDYTTANNTWGWPIGFQVLSPHNDNVSVMTRLEYYGKLSRQNVSKPASGSESVILKSSGVNAGNGTIQWNAPGTGTGDEGFVIFTITDIDSSVKVADIYIGSVTFADYTTILVYKDATSGNATENAFGLYNTPNTAWSAGHYLIYNSIAPTASFVCVPTSQFPSTDVVCTDTSTDDPTSWYWSIDAEALGIQGWQTSTSQNFTWQSAYTGLFSVNLRATNSRGSDWENKSSYVSISGNATPNNCNLPVQSGYVRTVFECLDSQSSSAVSGCDIQLRDNEAGAWSNATNRQDGLWCIDTLPSHTINGYGQATGYTSTSSLNLHALDLSEGMYYLLMIPGYVPAAPDGKVYLYVTVNDYDNSQMISSAYVTASWSGGGYAAATTSAAGTAILTVKNSTSIYITATKSGYVSVNRVISTTPFGPDSTTIGLHRMVVSPTATATTGPGGTVAPTVGPYGTTLPSGVMPAGYTNNQGQIMMDFLAKNGLSLVQLCFLVTILALLGVKLGK